MKLQLFLRSLLYMLGALCTGLVLWVFIKGSVFSNALNQVQAILLNTVVGGAVFAIVPIVIRYLQTTTPSKRELERAKQELGYATVQLKEEFRREIERVAAIKTEGGVPVDPAKVIENLRPYITTALTSEIQKHFSSEARQELHLSLINSLFEADLRRLSDQISLLRKRSNLNLAIGVSTTVAAAGILLFMVLGASSVSHDKYAMIAYYVPRVSTAAFVDIFAFFFLRLYKATLDEERFYQNELTARTARQMALQTASNLKGEAAIGKLVETFSLLNQNKSVAMTNADGSANLDEIVKIIDGATKVLSAVAKKKAE